MSVLMRLGILALEWLTLLGAWAVAAPYWLEKGGVLVREQRGVSEGR